MMGCVTQMGVRLYVSRHNGKAYACGSKHRYLIRVAMCGYMLMLVGICVHM